MCTPVSRHTVDAFLEARASRDQARIGGFLDDDVEWKISGPVDLLQYCGVHRGKDAVLDLFARIVPETFERIRYEPEIVLVDGDRAAVFSRISAMQRSTGRWISYRSAQFMQFRDDRIVAYHSLIDSFDAAEQVLGRSLDLSAPAPMHYALSDTLVPI